MKYDANWLNGLFAAAPHKKNVELAAYLGLDPTKISKMRADTRRIQPHEADMIKKFFGASASRDDVPLAGYVGAGAAIYPVDQSGAALDFVERPADADGNLVAALVKGDSMFPAYRDGDLIYYREHEQLPEEYFLREECVVQVREGPIYVKQVVRGPSPGKFTLRSHNAPDIEDIEISWASPVLWVKRRRAGRALPPKNPVADF